MKKLLAAVFLLLVMVTVIMAQSKDIPVIQVPEGQFKPVLLDGIMTPAEWDDALKVKIHERIDLLVKVNAGHLFLGLKFKDSAGVIVDLWLTSDDKTVYQMHSSGQLSEGVFKLPVKEDSIELSMGHTTDWDANEINSISFNGNISSEFDWREKNIMTPVKHQMNLGSWGIDDFWIISASGGEAKQLTFHESRDDHASWSPDGKQIAFASKRAGRNNDIWIKDVKKN